MKTNKNNLGIWIAVVVSIVLIVIFIFTAISNKNRNISVFASETESMADMMIGNADSYEDLINMIRTHYDTSASSYCVVFKNGIIEFEKDSQTTSSLANQTTIDSFLAKSEGTVDSPAKATTKNVLNDGKTYLISKSSKVYNSDEVVLLICNKESYVVSKRQLDLLIQYVILFSVLFAITFVAITFFQRNQNNKLVRKCEDLENKLVKGRIQIEDLESKAKDQQDMQMNDKSCGYFSKSTFDAILNALTPEQKQASSWAKAYVTEVDDQIKVAVLLDRINVKGVISCRWKDDEFYILVLNHGVEDVKQLVSRIEQRYSKDYQTSMPDFKIKIGKFGGNDEI